MKNKPLIIAGIIVLILAIWIVVRSSHNSTDTGSSTVATSTSTGGSQTASSTPSSGESLYTDPGGRFTFVYPSKFSVTGPKTALTTEWREGATSTGHLLATLAVPKSFMPGTNFSDAKFTVGESSDKTEVGASGCPANLAGYTPGSATAVTIGGQTFTKISTSDAGAGNLYDTTGYYTIRGSNCYAVEYTIHSTNIGNYDPSQGIKEFDEDTLKGILDKIVESFTFTGND